MGSWYLGLYQLNHQVTTSRLQITQIFVRQNLLTQVVFPRLSTFSFQSSYYSSGSTSIHHLKLCHCVPPPPHPCHRRSTSRSRRFCGGAGPGRRPPWPGRTLPSALATRRYCTPSVAAWWRPTSSSRRGRCFLVFLFSVSSVGFLGVSFLGVSCWFSWCFFSRFHPLVFLVSFLVSSVPRE